MTTIDIGNPAVSIQFGPNEQLIVPDGDVWRVNVSCPVAVRSLDETGWTAYNFEVNGEVVASSTAGERNSSWGRTFHSNSTLPLKGAVFVGGDTLTARDAEININGFVVGVLPDSSSSTLNTTDNSAENFEEI